MAIWTAAGACAEKSITQDGDVIRLRAGVIEKTIRISGGAVLSDGLTVAGTPLLDAKSEEMSFHVSRAAPNRNPLEVLSSSGAALSVAESKADGTDALAVDATGKAEPKGAAPGVTWVDVGSFSASRWDRCFEMSKAAAFRPQPGVERLQIRTRALKDPVLAGVTIHQFYETYDGFPVIRKWVEIHNNGVNWLRLDNLRIDGMQLAPEFRNQTMLTPFGRGAVASVLAFSHLDKSKGLIVASEVPSALRDIEVGGASGYNAEHFEWVVGPAECFISEPVFIYGFAGEVWKTASAASLPMDRAVEGGFKQFLREKLGISPNYSEIPAPLWCSWSNFGPKLTDAIVRQQADIAAKCGFAVMQLDDGWQKGRLGTRPDEKVFPQFRETCDYVRSKGLRLGLWVSCFRDPDAPDFQALPDAAIAPAVQRLGGFAMSFASGWRQYYARDLASLRDLYDATYFKQDFTNIKFGDLAAGHESRTRNESLLRGLRGLLESQSLLRRLAPDVANELTHEIYWGTPGTPCDLAALKNASLYHIPPNDYSGCGHPKERPGASAAWDKYAPDALRAELVRGCRNARNQLYAHRGLPLECVEYYSAATVNWKGSLTPQVQDRQICSWLMGAPAVFAGDLASLTEENIARYRNRFDILKRLEKTYGIYRRFQYSGVPEPTDTDWHWWGKLDPRGCGAVVVLRGDGGDPQRAVNIPWVDPGTTYAVTALLQNQPLGRFTGRQLQEGKLNLALPPLGQEILELSAADGAAVLQPAAVLASTGKLAGGNSPLADDPPVYDIVVYGDSAGAVTAAVAARRQGRSVILINPTGFLGGMSASGLGATDFLGRQATFGGIAAEFYDAVARAYGEKHVRCFEPHVAQGVFDKLVASARVPVVFNEQLDRETGVKRNGNRIVSITTLSGKTYRGKMFIDASYVGDLMAAAGVAYAIGREPESQYGENLAGVRRGDTSPRVHYTQRDKDHFIKDVDPYVTPGDPRSGLLPLVFKIDGLANGQGDEKIQAYNYRLCLTTEAKLRIPIEKPAGYRAIDHELLLRNFEAGDHRLPALVEPLAGGQSKVDWNSMHAVGSDYAGANWEYPEAGYARRREIEAAHQTYIRGHLWTLANSPRVPEEIRTKVAAYGLCKDEFAENGGWPYMIYIREARRMVSDYVMTQLDCEGKRVAADPVGLGSFGMDSHVVQYYVNEKGCAQRDGTIWRVPPKPYGISYRSIIPRKGQCENLLAPVCLSASHVAHGSIRMEPVFMVLGQSAATAAGTALDTGVSVQEVAYPVLLRRLDDDKQIVEYAASLKPIATARLEGSVSDPTAARLEK